MFEREAFYEVENIIKQLYKCEMWHSLDDAIRKHYTNELKHWQRRLPEYANDDEDKDGASKEDNSTYGDDSNGKTPDRIKYYGHPISLDKITEELGFAPAAPFSVEDYVVQEELYQALYVAIGSLTEKERGIMVIHFVEGKSEEKTGAELGLTKSQVHCRIPKIIGKLQESLKDFR